MVLGIDPKVDYAFKRLFGDPRNSAILIHLLNAILQLAEPIVAIEILNPFNDKDFSEDKLSVLDIKARDQVGRLFNVEMQLLLPRHFRSRILYYQAGVYRRQLSEGEAYGELRPVISICLVNQIMFPDVEDYHLDFHWLNERHGIRFSDDLAIHVLQLPRFRCSAAELRGPLEKWLYFLRHAESFDVDHVPAELDEPVYQRAVKELEMLTQDEIERERYESRQMAIRDQLSLEKEYRNARAEGRAEGREEGREEGVDQGQCIGQIQLSQRLLKRPQTSSQELLNMPLDELHRMASELESELLARPAEGKS